jgi:hypothetical protein
LVQADFAAALEHRDHHDVRNSDRAHQQRDHDYASSEGDHDDRSEGAYRSRVNGMSDRHLRA